MFVIRNTLFALKVSFSYLFHNILLTIRILSATVVSESIQFKVCGIEIS